jgi:hypothetical protein
MPEFDNVKDSGTREAFETGSQRDTRVGKGRFDLISPIFLKRLAKHYENGSLKYKDRNWEKGQPLARYLDSAERHLNDFKEGKRDEDHLAAVAWNIAAIIHTQEMIDRGLLPKELNDLPTYVKKEEPKVEVKEESEALVICDHAKDKKCPNRKKSFGCDRYKPHTNKICDKGDHKASACYNETNMVFIRVECIPYVK